MTALQAPAETAPSETRAPLHGVNPREKTARRLLGSSAKNSYSPDLDIDWDAEPVEGMWHMQPERMSLYGTALWDSLTPEQQLELSKHEVVSIARVGLWFEILLMGMLASHAYNQDPASEHTQYALTEIGDETRHSVMFARWADKYGGVQYKPHPVVHHLGKLFRLVAPTGPSMWAATLVAEELLDRLQREGMADERMQPMSRMVSRIHVIEEARHVRFAREELVRSMADAHQGPVLWFHQVFAALAAAVIAESIISPKVYASVGLDPKQARRIARRNPEFHATKRWMGEKILPFLDEVGMINPVARFIYRRAHLI
ncbi:MAG TPA: diiron oxygenase [Jatrophihabitantaceae bacterium]|nr:diiron oxygenase [Jatrophihabitantaceae bacterium]